MPHFDTHRVHSVERTTRLEHDGYDYEAVVNSGSWTSIDGKAGTNENVNHVARPRYRERVDERIRYENIEDLIKLKQRDISTLGVGWCLEVPGGESPVYTPMEPIPWSDMIVSRNPRVTLAERKFELLMEARRQERSEYQTPSLQMPPPPPPPDTRATGLRGGKSGKRRSHD